MLQVHKKVIYSLAHRGDITLSIITTNINNMIILFSYAIYSCFGSPYYFIGTYQKLIFLLDVNNVISGYIRVSIYE